MVDALVSLMSAMTATTSTTWRHAPWFGLHEKFLEARLEREDQQGLADAFNLAFDKLGIEWARVHAVHTAARRDPGERRFELTLMVDGSPVFRDLGD